jgi:hypothetical protein
MNPHHARVTLFSGKAGDFPSAPRTNSFATALSLDNKSDRSAQTAFRALLLVTGSFAAVWLLPSGVVAEEAAPSPLLMPMSSLAPTPTPTPTATPFHVVMEQAPFWNSALGIFLTVVLATVADVVTKAAMGTIR